MRRKHFGSAQPVILVLIAALVLYLVAPKVMGSWLGLLALAGLVLYLLLKKDQAATASVERSSDRAAEAASPRAPRASGRTAEAPNSGRRDAAPARWVPPGESVMVASTVIPGGMLYVGSSLPTPSGKNDPALIDPTLPVSTHGDYTERQFGYWPSYSEITPQARRAYLNWLAGGRRAPTADIGYVFLYFYGLERRAILDAAQDEAARKDWSGIAEELRQLLDVYGQNNSFRNYASSLLDLVSVADHPQKAYLKPVPRFPKTFELPLYLRLALGQAALDGAPVPAPVALALAKHEPTVYLRTPAVRCADEFDRVFEAKYRESFGEGIVLPRNRTKLKLVHRPASAGFRGYKEPRLDFEDIPDVSVLTGPVKKLRDVVEAATTALEPFSRYVGKNPAARHALEGLLQLPATLWPQTAQKALEGLKARMGAGMVALSFQELLATLDAKSTLTRDKSLALARALESLNIGIEPDVLSGAKLPKPDEKVVLFSVPPGEEVSRSTPTYQAAALTLQLAAAVAAADGEFSAEELAHLREQVQSWTHLTPNHIRRLLAHLRLLYVAPVTLTTLKKRLEPLDAAARQAIAKFMATVAQSDGTVSAAEVKTLEKVYKALGLEPKKVFSDVHAVAAGGGPLAGAPSPGTAPSKSQDSGFKLDPARVAALQKETAATAALLADIFKEDESTTAAVQVEAVEEVEEAPAPSAGLLGLDEAHSALARLLLSRPQWTKQELGDVAADLDLMVDGALEALNEAAFDKHDLAFTEGEDPVSVNPELLERIEA